MKTYATGKITGQMLKSKILVPLGVVTLLMTAPDSSNAAILFSDDFEKPLGLINALTDPDWLKNSNGTIVVDPLDATNKALNFSSTDFAGDLFSKTINLTAGVTYSVEFDFLGQPGGARSGAFAGFTNAGGSNPHGWYAGTGTLAQLATELTVIDTVSSQVQLLDNVGWQRYSYQFIAPIYFDSPGSFTGIPLTDITLIFEDFSAPAGNAYFDNIRLSSSMASTPVPNPVTLLLFGTGLAIMGLFGRKTRRHARAA